MNPILSPFEAHEHVIAYGQRASQEVRRREAPFDIGQWARQGDVYLIAIKAKPKGAKAVAHQAEIQLALGQTMGSRHMLRMSEGVTLYRVVAPGPLDGGTIVAKGRCYINHPEHAHMDLPPGIYAVTYQRDLSAEEIRAVRD